LYKLFEKTEIFKMRMYFLMVDKLLKVLSYSFDVIINFLYIEIGPEVFLGRVGFIEFNKIGIIKITDFFKTRLKNVFFYILINFAKRHKFLNYFLANKAGT